MEELNKQEHHLQPLPAKGFIGMISGSSTLDFENKRQRRDYVRMVNTILVDGPIKKSKWLHIPITFTDVDLKLKSYSHNDAFVI